MPEFDITSTKEVVELSSNSTRTCPHCQRSIGDGDYKLDQQINHYLGHGYALIHLGSEHRGTMLVTVALMAKGRRGKASRKA